ncbi:hypothetical protein NLI96_g6680 [Meripilus lineatus]|uniref:TNase-like domain-containing protein n=1 Tax=Meripilus lineatus TaxID=2056292 RepID=A0AAD5V2A3_9APHY|nr:hypothetical protein NLI96_g6680 [Physisporinus lineatus]
MNIWPFNRQQKRSPPDRKDLEKHLPLILFASGSLTAIILSRGYRRFFKRIPNGEWITPDIIQRKKWIKGAVTRRVPITEKGDYPCGLSMLHISLENRSLAELKDKTIHIRLAGIDAPENAHFGGEAQPHAKESHQWLRNEIEGKIVYCQLLRKDQYARIVSAVHHKPFFLPSLRKGKSIQEEMLRAGCAMVYEQAGAEYGDAGKYAFLSLQDEAQKARRGMWKRGTKIETPAEYKRKRGTPPPVVEPEPEPKSSLRKLLHF